MTFDPRTETNIATLTPNTQAVARKFMQAVIESNRLPSGWTVKIISGLRSYEQQAALYAQGRDGHGGKIVTNAGPGYSNHNFGTAFDIGIFNATGHYIDDLVDSGVMTEKQVGFYYELFPAIGRALGLIWGGDWKSIDDEPHYELNQYPALSENDKLAKYRAMREAGEAIP